MKFYSPIWNAEQFFDTNNNIVSNGTIRTYLYPSWSVEGTTYSDQDGDVPNSNPIELDESGYNRTPIWLDQGVAYNFELLDVNGNQIQVGENIIGIQPSQVAGSGPANTVWNLVGEPTFISATQFSVEDNHSVEFAVGNRVKLVNSGEGGTTYGTVTAVTVISDITYVTIYGDAIINTIEEAYWSVNTAAGATVDAAGVAYTQSLNYSDLDTAGGRINALQTSVANGAVAILDRNTVYEAVGTAGAFVLTPDPAATLGVNDSYDVTFDTDGGATPTLNVSGTGDIGIYQIDYDNTYIPAVIFAGMSTRVLFDGTDWVIAGAVPPPPPDPPIAISVMIAHHSTSGNGGNGTTSWTTRPLNSVQINTISGASLAANMVTLPAGTYIASGYTVFFANDDHKTRLQNVTAGSTICYSNAGWNRGGDGRNNVPYYFQGVFILLSPANIAVQSIDANTGTNAHGETATSFGGAQNTWVSVMFQKIA